MKIVMGGPFRIFISYARWDRQFAERLVRIVKRNGLLPLWDGILRPARPFSEEIKYLIACSHVFVPLLTPASVERGWVHEEIGYAVAHGLPVLPIARGELPPAMLEGLQPLSWTKDERELKRVLSAGAIQKLLTDLPVGARPVYECAETNEERLRMLTEYARHVERAGFYGIIRQRGALSSFHIPDKPPGHRLFLDRYGRRADHASEERNKLLRAERRAMESHARKRGCRLLLNPYLEFEEYGEAARASRLGVLLEFLKGIRVDNDLDYVDVALSPDLLGGENFMAVGDWFVAESLSRYTLKGFRNTVFTRHAATVREKVQQFDDDFLERLESQRLAPGESLKPAIDELERILSKLKPRMKKLW
jgi:hypothetical protein